MQFNVEKVLYGEEEIFLKFRMIKIWPEKRLRPKVSQKKCENFLLVNYDR